MKKIINGKKYDTETATFIEEYQYSYPGDFHHYKEELYQKKTKEFFLYGVGGPASKYAEACPTGGWDGGSGIIPLSEEEAREWLENNSDVETYEKVFGEAEE